MRPKQKQQTTMPLAGGANPVPSKGQLVFELAAQHLSYLEQRWADESEYEDWSDYEAAARDRIADAGGTLVSIKPDPFHVAFHAGDPAEVYHVTFTARALRLNGPFRRVLQ